MSDLHTTTGPAAEPPDSRHTAQLHIAAALDQLDSDHWDITPIPGTITSTRRWPDGSVDTLILLNPETAYLHRRNPHGDTVWARKDTLDEMINAALKLAPPDSADAPSEPIPERTEPDL